MSHRTTTTTENIKAFTASVSEYLLGFSSSLFCIFSFFCCLRFKENLQLNFYDWRENVACGFFFLLLPLITSIIIIIIILATMSYSSGQTVRIKRKAKHGRKREKGANEL